MLVLPDLRGLADTGFQFSDALRHGVQAFLATDFS